MQVTNKQTNGEKMSIFDFKLSIFDYELKYAFWVVTFLTAFVLTTWRKDNSAGELTATLLILIAALLAGILVMLYYIAVKLGATAL